MNVWANILIMKDKDKALTIRPYISFVRTVWLTHKKEKRNTLDGPTVNDLLLFLIFWCVGPSPACSFSFFLCVSTRTLDLDANGIMTEPHISSFVFVFLGDEAQSLRFQRPDHGSCLFLFSFKFFYGWAKR